MADGAFALDFADCFSETIGALGLRQDDVDAARARLAGITRELNAARGSGPERWRTLPDESDRATHVAEARAIAGRLGPTTDDLVVIGIGGSALGASAVHRALHPSTWNLLPGDTRGGPRFFVLDNVDPERLVDTLDVIRAGSDGPDRVTVVAVSKSGETLETLAQLAVVRDALSLPAERLVAITDADGGTLRARATEDGAQVCTVPDGVGGRFSVLSPVGLVPLAIAGVDPDPLLAGAAAIDEQCRAEDLEENPAAMLAWVLVEHARRGRGNNVMMPYADALTGLVQWWRQLWAESLGKRTGLDGAEAFAGLTPIAALGATDQHSQVQLYREGPADKVVGFIGVTRPQADVRVPDDGLGETSKWLGGRTIGEILSAEREATRHALRESGRPSFTLTLSEVRAEHVGAFVQLWMIATSYAGRLLGVNAYDQPAVETGKIEAARLLRDTSSEHTSS